MSIKQFNCLTDKHSALSLKSTLKSETLPVSRNKVLQEGKLFLVSKDTVDDAFWHDMGDYSDVPKMFIILAFEVQCKESPISYRYLFMYTIG